MYFVGRTPLYTSSLLPQSKPIATYVRPTKHRKGPQRGPSAIAAAPVGCVSEALHCLVRYRSILDAQSFVGQWLTGATAQHTTPDNPISSLEQGERV
jgi:hypothetical protein